MKLDKRQQFIIDQRLGKKDGFPKTLQQIANHLGITRQRVSQIETQAILKLIQSDTKNKY